MHILSSLVTTSLNLHYKVFIIGDHRPLLKYLNQHVRKVVGDRWHDLGVELLEVDDVKELDTIRSQHSTDINICCTQMFNLWLQKQPKASWNQLITSLRNIELIYLATKIEQMLLEPTPKPKPPTGIAIAS